MFTVDTSKDHCPIRIAYTKCNPAAGPLHSHELSENHNWTLRPMQPLAIIKATEHSDYSGSDVEASNYRVLSEAKDIDYLVQIYGSHGYKALAYDATLGPIPTVPELAEMLEALEGYPLLDEDDHGALELQLETEAWEDHGLSDFRRKFELLLDGIDHEHSHELPDNEDLAPNVLAVAVSDYAGYCSVGHTWESLLWDLWRLGCDQLNVNGGTGFQVKTGCIVYFHIDDWMHKAGLDPQYHSNWPILGLLRELAEACRVIDPDAYCREHGCPRATCDESHSAEVK